ncbi:MAG: glycosyltransferase family 4 protein [Bacteroidales bacterium]
MEGRKRILLIDFTDFENYPIGGYLTFAKNMMESFGNDLALVGITTSSEDPLGRWFNKTINGVDYDFFAMAYYSKTKTRNIIPDRLANYFLARYFKRKIYVIGIANIFFQRQESLLAIADSSKNVCYSFPGLDNPLAISKYRYAGFVAEWFERKFFRKVLIANTILARGDDEAIRQMIERSRGALDAQRIIKFPTRINANIFKPLAINDARKALCLPGDIILVSTTGRLAWLKGWKFMIDAFAKFAEVMKGSHFVIIGEGEDFTKIKSYISDNNLGDRIVLTGKKSREDIALYINASDLYIMGSYKEGWPTALMEAVACGVPSCVTEFSSVDQIVLDGINGYVVRERNEDLFVSGMLNAIKLKRPVKNDHVTRYSTANLKNDILKHWQLK